jgi:hypothetical protein
MFGAEIPLFGLGEVGTETVREKGNMSLVVKSQTWHRRGLLSVFLKRTVYVSGLAAGRSRLCFLACLQKIRSPR